MYKEYGWRDEEINSTKYIYPKLVQLLSQCKARTILDMGCGNGEIANKLIEEGFEVYGVDASEEGIKIAEKHHAGCFYVMNFEEGNLPCELQAVEFDTIISTEVIEHLYSPRQYVELCKKILLKCTRGGVFVITTPYHGYLKNLMMAFVGKLDAHFTVLWEGGHIKFWSRKTITRLLKEQGFEVEQFIGCGRISYLWKSMMVVSRLR